MTSQRDKTVVNLRPGEATLSRQGLPYFTGISAATAGSQSLSMSLLEVPPGATSEPHIHDGYETAIYVLTGRVETRFGQRLEHTVISEAGDFVFVPPGIPHQARNLSTDQPARAVVARNDANEAEKVLPYQVPGNAED